MVQRWLAIRSTPAEGIPLLRGHSANAFASPDPRGHISPYFAIASTRGHATFRMPRHLPLGLVARRVHFLCGEKTMCEKSSEGLKVPSNWDEELPAYFDQINAGARVKFPIREAYASDSRSVTGGGRDASSLAERKRPFKFYIDALHRYGIRFDYLLNAAFLGGAEFTVEMQRRVLDVVRELVDANVDSLTVANPVLAMVIADQFPHLELSTSVNNHLDSRERVQQLFQHVPYQTIMLDHRHSRNFPLIRNLRQRFPDHSIVVLVNESCLPDCVIQPHHQDFLACVSRTGGLGDDSIDICHVLCARQKLRNPEYVLKAPWIRPDDVHHVFEAGATLVKLAGRTQNTDWIIKVATAYANGSYGEDDVWPFIEKSGLTSKDWNKALGRVLEPCRYVVHNRALDGFITPFVNGTAPCLKTHGGCAGCGYCKAWFAKAVECPSNATERLTDLQQLQTRFLGRRQGIHDGKVA